MKSILVPVSGGASDRMVLDTALALARPLAAHLDLLHIVIDPGEAARHTPHIDFARGPAIHNALAELQQEADARLSRARHLVAEFRRRTNLIECNVPYAAHTATFSYQEQCGEGLACLLGAARHHDVTVVARHGRPDGMVADRLDRILLESGRPIVVAPASQPVADLDNVMVCWRETADAARVLGAAMPILARAVRVHVVTIPEETTGAAAGLANLVRQLGWAGVSAEGSVLEGVSATADSLLAAAQERRAKLVIMGGYGRSHTREMLFGGCTQQILDNADLPVFMLH